MPYDAFAAISGNSFAASDLESWSTPRASSTVAGSRTSPRLAAASNVASTRAAIPRNCRPLARNAATATSLAALRTVGAPAPASRANEVAVAAFLARGLQFLGIAALVEATLEAAAKRGLVREPTTVEDALGIDYDSRSLAAKLLPEIAAKAS